MAITSGSLKATNLTAAATSADYGQAPDQRRLYDFSDRVAELSPDESPFFVYLNKMAKSPTNDPVFRFLENRSKIDWTTRTFELAAHVNGESAVTAGAQYAFSVDDSSSGSATDVNWLQKGMVFAVQTLDAAIGTSYATVRIDSAVTDTGSANTFTGRIIALPHSDFSTGYNVLSANDKCQVIGTSFEEGTGSPDVWSKSLDDDFGYTQIFKTAAEMTNTAIATNYRGYANEWSRIWNLKLREHKVDIERGMLFGQKGRQNGIQSSAGLVGDIINRVAAGTPGSLSYSAGNPYFGAAASTSFTYDTFLSDFEVFFDPARGGSPNKLALAGLPVISYFNKMGAGLVTKSLDTSASTESQSNLYNFNASERDGTFGHKIMQLNTVHGDLA